MAWAVSTTSSLLTELAYRLFNETKVSQLPVARGRYGIDETVADQLVALTRSQYQAITTVPLAANANMQGACIYASVIAAKFLRHRGGFYSTHVVHVNPAKDHYFTVGRESPNGDPIIADITCRQFQGAPNLIIGRLRDIKGQARQAKVTNGPTLYEAYEVGAKTSDFLI